MEKTILRKWGESTYYLIEEKLYNIVGKIQTLVKDENLLNQMSFSLHSVIIIKIRRFGGLNVMMAIWLQANNHSQLITIPSLPFSLMTQAELNEFELEIDLKNMLYWRVTFSMDTICTFPNMPAMPLV